MKTRDNKSFDTLEEIVQYLGDPERVGKDNTWVAKNYSLAQLIKDLQKVKEKINGIQNSGSNHSEPGRDHHGKSFTG